MEKLQLWYCDTFINTPWQFVFLIVPLVGAWLYGRGKTKIAWILIGSWIAIQITLSALTNLIFVCVMPD
jgi:hypothetical protein